MSEDITLVDYAKLKRHYDCDDYVSLVVNGIPLLNGIPFTNAAEDYYVVGLMAYFHDNNIIDVFKGWCEFAHGQPAAPLFLQPFLAALGITTWPTSVPAFEGKQFMFLSVDSDCWIRFEGSSRVRHYIPLGTLAAGPYITFSRRAFKFYVQGLTNNGTLYVWITG